MNIAVWGGTGHVGRALYYALINKGFNCHTYVRNFEKADRYLPSNSFSGFSEFPSRKYDILINGIAAGAVQERFLFETLEKWDWRLIEFAKEHPKCCCVSISSGAAYGCNFSAPVDDKASMTLCPNHVEKSQIYGLIKLMCEQRHRSFQDLPLVDLRLFAFFTRHMDLEQPFFMSEVIKAVKNDDVLVTQSSDFYRDFTHPDDFAELISLCARKKINAEYDLYSKSPIKKSEILDIFVKRYGLRYSGGEVWQSLTGNKSHYFSNSRKAAELGYEPEFSSFDVLISESDYILSGIVNSSQTN
jgi:nucleoside-diphosphate-sugar epimerase